MKRFLLTPHWTASLPNSHNIALFLRKLSVPLPKPRRKVAFPNRSRLLLEASLRRRPHQSARSVVGINQRHLLLRRPTKNHPKRNRLLPTGISLMLSPMCLLLQWRRLPLRLLVGTLPVIPAVVGLHPLRCAAVDGILLLVKRPSRHRVGMVLRLLAVLPVVGTRHPPLVLVLPLR